MRREQREGAKGGSKGRKQREGAKGRSRGREQRELREGAERGSRGRKQREGVKGGSREREQREGGRKWISYLKKSRVCRFTEALCACCAALCLLFMCVARS